MRFSNFFPHFIYSLALWILYSQLPEQSPAPFNQETYLSLIGAVKYTAPLLLSVFAGYIVRTRVNRRFSAQLLVGAAGFIYFLGSHATGAISNLLILCTVALLAVLYEPIIDVLCAFYGEKQGNYLSVNSAMTLVRTSARMLGPLITLYLIVPYLRLPLSQIVSLLLGLAALFVVFAEFPDPTPVDEGSLVVSGGFFSTLQSVLANPTSAQLLIVYSTFYLSINYLEYLVTLLPTGSPIALSSVYSVLGGGFVASNVFVLLFKKRLDIRPVHLSSSLALTGFALFALPLLPGRMLFLGAFLAGFGNGISVPLGASIIQSSLPRSQIAVFSGALETCVNACGIISMGLGIILFHFFGAVGVFYGDAILVLGSAFIWNLSFKRRPGYVAGAQVARG